MFRGGNCDGESGARAAMVPSAVDETTMFRSTRRDFFVRASSCLSVKSKAVSNRRRLKEVTRSFFPFANALSRSRRYFREEFPGQIGFFKGAFFSRFEMPTAVVFSRLSSVGVFSCQESRPARHHTSCHASDRRPSFRRRRGRPFSGPRARAAARVGAAAPRPRTSAGGRLWRRRASQTPPPCPGPRRVTRRTRMAGCPGRGSCGNSTTP